MTARKPLTTRTAEQDNLLELVNKEYIPFLRQFDGQVRNPKRAFTGSRATFTAFELQVLSILVAAGIATDSTTP